MPDPTNPNPKKNQDSTRSQTTENPDSWASPKSGDGDGFIKFDSDDIQPERKRRLGEYLSNHSSGNISGPDNDNSNGRSSHFPVSNPEPTEYSPFTNSGESYTGLLEATAEYYFENLSKQTSFIPSVGGYEGGAKENAPRVQDGHKILDSAPSIVEAHLTDSITNSGSRWSGIGVEKFNPNDNPDGYQVKRAGPHLDRTPLEQTKGSRFSSFEHLNGQKNSDSLKDKDFWDDYFSDMQKVGAKITLAAQGYKNKKDASNMGARGSVSGGGGITGGPAGFGSLEGNYKRVELSGLQPGNAFDSNEEFEDVKISEAKTLTSESWGQMYSWASPYDKANFVGSNKALAVAGQLLEIWSMVQLRILVITSVFQAASMILSTISSPPFKSLGKKDFNKILWNRNYYPKNPQTQAGNYFLMGQSGANHSPIDIIDRAMEEINELSAQIDGYAGFLVPQLLGGAVNQASKILEEEYLNFTRNVLKEVNIYIPRHTMSTSANVSGYNDTGSGANLFVKTLDVATAYTRATAAGMGSLSMHIIGGDYGQSLGYWRNIFREVVRSKANLSEIEINESGGTSAYESILRFVGKDDKLMSFVNYLAMIGDMDIGRGFAGKLAFPENKVPLKSVSNFPTLRTASTRKKGRPQDKTILSRLAMTETPSLYLIPKSINNIRLGLEETGLAKSGGAWGNFTGKNQLANKKINDTDKKANTDGLTGIEAKWQARAESRFSADQVRRIEDQLEAEHMPFYIQDLRTNEVISFHAFLTSLSDSYTGEWTAQKGFGRLEAAQIYGGGSRSIGVSFMLVSMNKEDFNEMYVKINKLTTLVYPQWSEGTAITTGEGTFVQPFSQVPTASPLCRLRVGDLFTTNYSKQNMARMMGVGRPDFAYGGSPIKRDNTVPVPGTASDNPRYIRMEPFLDLYENLTPGDRGNVLEQYLDNSELFLTTYDTNEGIAYLQSPGIIQRIQEWKSMTLNEYYEQTLEIVPTSADTANIAAVAGKSINDLFSSENPIFKAFDSTMGRGIPVAITGISLDWKLGSVPWELKAGSRAPKMCEVQLSVVPIHDITPGLDHEGFNRAPIYRVGDTMSSVGGDAWYNNSDKKKLVAGIETQHQEALEGKGEEE